MPKILDGDGRRQSTSGPLKASKYGAGRTRNLGDAVCLSTDAARDTVAAINAVLDAGDAIMFARTSGGGILTITVYQKDSEPTKFYPKTADEAQDTLADIENIARG